MPYQGKRLDGSPFEDPDFDHHTYKFQITPRAKAVRTAGVHFDEIWHADRMDRGAFGFTDRSNFLLKQFMSKWLLFEETNEEDAEWGPIRPLGEGTWGSVGLWQKRDDKNNIIDEVACKEQLFTSQSSPENYEVDSTTNDRLTREAAIQRDINHQHPGAAPHLRGYKVILDKNFTHTGKYRSYVEYCPYGSLNHIRRLYRCWDTFLPEVFLWHLFFDLAKACEALRDCPPEDSKGFTEEFSEVREDLVSSPAADGRCHFDTWSLMLLHCYWYTLTTTYSIVSTWIGNPITCFSATHMKG